MKVHIRKRKGKNGKLTLALEIYTGYDENKTGTMTARRKTERLQGYFLYENPKNAVERDHNKEVELKADAIRGSVLRDLLNEKHGFRSTSKTKANFIDYFQRLTDERFNSTGNYGNWDSALKKLIKYRGKNVAIEQVDVEFCEGFKTYLMNTARTKTDSPLSSSSVNSYFCKLRAALNQAVDDDIILVNPCLKVSTPKTVEAERQFLTPEEIRKLKDAECRYDVLKRAFLFSCLTGIRWSDIQKMTWSQIQDEEGKLKVVFHQKKTKGLEYLYLSDQVRQLIGSRQQPNEKVFLNLKYSMYHNVAIAQWVLRAGITKHITFHCARHTFATMLLTQGVDLYTVSKLLGHKDIKTTQLYVKVIDQKKIDAVSLIPDFEL